MIDSRLYEVHSDLREVTDELARGNALSFSELQMLRQADARIAAVVYGILGDPEVRHGKLLSAVKSDRRASRVFVND
ncbi:MAG: hypothetical protein GEU73_16415 [Chloroflexi bacterium]|nr:hypothetical protein [Chloroflexota bacterium]